MLTRSLTSILLKNFQNNSEKDKRETPMTFIDSFNLDAVIDVSNSVYRAELMSLCKSCAINPVLVEENASAQKLMEGLSEKNARHCLYITDKIDEQILKATKSLGAMRVDNILIVDDESKDKVNDSPALMSFNHVLSCTQQHVPHLQIMSTVRKIREQKFFGVDKCVAYGAYVHRYVLSHSDQRQWFRDALHEFVKGLA